MNNYTVYTVSMRFYFDAAVVGRKWTDRGYTAEIVSVENDGRSQALCLVKYTLAV